MKKFFTFLTLLCLLNIVSFGRLSAQVTGTIGTGTATTTTIPVNTNWGYTYSQQLYTAAQLTAAIGNTNRVITKIRFYVNNMTGNAATDYSRHKAWKVYMTNTTKANFASTTDWVPLSNLTNVFSDDIPAPVNGTWLDINLATPFVWDGTSNIVVAVDENSDNYYSYIYWGSFTSGTNSAIYYYSDSVNPDPATPPAASGRTGTIPRLQLVAEPLQPCTTAPPTNIVASNLTPTSATISWLPASGATYTVRYRVSPSGAWTTINNATYPLTIPGLSELTTYDVQIATTCGGVTGAFSSSITFTTPSISYCNAGSTSTTITGYISNVLFEPQGSNVMSSTSGYSTYTDYTGDATRLIKVLRNSTTNKISVTKFWPGTTSAMGVGVWIDWNRNGTFEAGEKVFTGASNNTALSASPNNIAVPATAYNGPLPIRMRVVLQSGGASSACGTFTNGEVEDYHILLIDQPPCTTAPPTNIMVTNLSPSSGTVSWLAASNAVYNVRYRQTGTTAWLPSNAGQTLAAGVSSYVMTGLTEGTTYEVQVQTVCSGSTGAFSPSTVFTTPPLQYCIATSQAATGGFISNVTVTPNTFPAMSNTSGAGTYTNYNTPATLIDLFAGSTGNTISVDKSWPGTPAAAGVGVWIDFNRDGDFNDVGEKILNAGSNVNTPATASFSVPATAYTGPLYTTMRVIMRQGASPNPCDSFPLGEVEDYKVRIRICDTTAPSNVIVNPITDVTAVVNWTPAPNNLSYIVEHRVVGSGAIWTQSPVMTAVPPYTLTGLTPATKYEVRIVAVCGTSIGSYTTPVEFTTNCDPAAPYVSVNQITPYTAVVNWTATANASYVLRYRKLGDPLWLPQPTGYMSIPAGTTSQALTGLTPYTKYEVQVANICNGSTVINTWSTSSVFTTERLCDMPPPGLTIINITPTTAEVQWDPYPGSSYTLRYRKVGIPSWTEITTNTNTYILTNLLEETKYEMQVANICNGAPGNYSDPYYFITPTVIYCSMSSGNAGNEHISKVIVKPNGKPEMISTSLSSTYTDYTSDPKRIVELIQGSSGNQITVDKAWLGASSNVGVAVWIDFNRDGVFSPNERILSQGPDSASPVTATFNVPNDAFISLTDFKYVVMRVALQKGSIPVNCISFDDGEVEDYTVRISKPGSNDIYTQTGISIYPNPVKNHLFFKVEGDFQSGKYKLYNSAGQLVGSDVILDRKIGLRGDRELIREVTLHGLVSGAYFVDIEINTKINGNVTTITAQKKFIKE